MSWRQGDLARVIVVSDALRTSRFFLAQHFESIPKMQKDEQGHVTVTTQEARSGETSGHVRVVLIVGLILAIVGLIVTFVIWR